MKTVIIHGWAQDNAGSQHKPGTVLKVDDDGGEGCITAADAAALVKMHSASPHHHEHKAAAKAD